MKDCDITLRISEDKIIITGINLTLYDRFKLLFISKKTRFVFKNYKINHINKDTPVEELSMDGLS